MPAPAGDPLQHTSAKTLVNANSGLRFARSPRWFRQKLLFLDVHDRCIKSVDTNGTFQTVMTLPYLPGGFEIVADGGMIVGDAWRRKLYRWETANRTQMADLSSIAGFCLSDTVIDNRGGMYVSDVGFNFLDPFMKPVPHGVIVHINPGGDSSVVAENLFFPNGMVITPDNRTLIVAEGLGCRLTAFEIENDGTLHHRRVWAQFQDDVKPDGICLDEGGAIWVAGTGPCALRITEGGAVDQQITTDLPVFATVLGGPDGRHLFMFTSTSNDPVITRRVMSATIDIAEVRHPGCGFP